MIPLWSINGIQRHGISSRHIDWRPGFVYDVTARMHVVIEPRLMTLMTTSLEEDGVLTVLYIRTRFDILGAIPFAVDLMELSDVFR